MDIFEWTESTPVTANNLNTMQNQLNDNITENGESITSWNVAGTNVGNSSISLPATFKELLIIVKLQDNANVALNILIPENILVGTATGYNTGYYRSASVNAWVRVFASTSEVYLGEAWLNNNSVLSSSSIKVYYR